MTPLRIIVLGYPMEISMWFFAVVCMLLLLDSEGILRWCILAAILHECGHVVAMRLLRWPGCRIRLTGLGIRLLQTEKAAVSYWSEGVAAAAGPAVNVGVGLLLVLIRGCIIQTVPEGLIQAQFSLGLFNLLPVEPMDGGRILRAILHMYLSDGVAEQIADAVTFIVLFPLTAGLFVSLFRQRLNFSLLAAVLYLVIFFVQKRR